MLCGDSSVRVLPWEGLGGTPERATLRPVHVSRENSDVICSIGGGKSDLVGMYSGAEFSCGNGFGASFCLHLAQVSGGNGFGASFEPLRCPEPRVGMDSDPPSTRIWPKSRGGMDSGPHVGLFGAPSLVWDWVRGPFWLRVAQISSGNGSTTETTKSEKA